MKRLDLKFEHRIPLIDMLANYRGPLAKVHALGMVFDAVRFSEQETAQIKTVDMGGGQVRVQPPSAEFGAVSCQIEDASASALLDELAAHQGMGIADREWTGEVKRQLAVDVAAKGKRR